MPYIIGGYLMKLSPQLDSLWYRELAIVNQPGGYNLLFDLRPTPGKGLVAFGYARNLSGNVNDLWIVKTDSLGCVVGGCENIGLKEHPLLKEGLSLYPNPVQDYTMVEGPEYLMGKKVGFALYTTDGQLLEQRENVSLPYLYQAGHLKPGAYILKYKMGKLTGQIRLLKL